MISEQQNSLSVHSSGAGVKVIGLLMIAIFSAFLLFLFVKSPLRSPAPALLDKVATPAIESQAAVERGAVEGAAVEGDVVEGDGKAVNADAEAAIPVKMEPIKAASVTPTPEGKPSKANLSVDEQLVAVLQQAGITPLDLGPTPDSSKAKLGQLLFFDKLLSGNKDISCATCHHPLLHTGDSLSLSFGTGAEGLGLRRKMGAGRELVPRNAPEIFNRGAPKWRSMFWDGRIEGSVAKGFRNPANSMLPPTLDSVLAVQAMFPVASRDEMRGELDDVTLLGEQNDLGRIEDGHITVVWEQLMKRLLAVPAYRAMFQEVYPEVPLDKLGFEHAANALAAFQISAFSFDDSPWDHYVAGDRKALSAEAKQGALLFYGKANCAVCHSGNLMTDQEYHNIGAPQLGPGKDSQDDWDFGRFLESEEFADAFAFRTPPLRNVALTGPWLHNGAYTSLEDVVRHYSDVETALYNYDPTQLDPNLQAAYHDAEKVAPQILQTLDPLVATPLDLSDEEVQQLLAFLEGLTSPSAMDLAHTIPSSVPSGLPLDELHD
ncbi:MAG: cytochrome-c peroxidase [Ardenticatenaceae bacterium]